MIAHVVHVHTVDGSRMHYLKLFHARQLVLVLLFGRIDNLLTITGVTDIELSQQTTQMRRVVVFVGTAVVITRGGGGVALDDFGAAVGCVIGAFAFAAVHVSNVVGVLFLKGFARDVGKVALKKEQGIVHGESGAFEKESVLQTAPVFEFLVLLQAGLELAHAEGHVGDAGCDGGGRQAATAEAMGLCSCVGINETGVQIFEERIDADLFVAF